MTTKEEIRDLKKACILLQEQIGALHTLYQELSLNKVDKLKPNEVRSKSNLIIKG